MRNKYWRQDRKLTAMMVEDMLFDPILACKVLLRIELPPHQELRILWMWTRFYTNDDSGFSTGKTFNLAVVAALRSILMKGRIGGMISKTFAQGKLIFDNFDRWYDMCPIYRSCVQHAGGKKRMIHANDAHVVYYRGGGATRILPPDFLKDSERIRSERWHDGYFDEWTVYGNYGALQKTFIGRISNINHFKLCPVRQNHIHLASTPAHQGHASYAIIKNINQEMKNGHKEYGRFTSNYRHIPQGDKWGFLVSEPTIYHMQKNNSQSAVTSEIDGKWSKDTGDYYPITEVRQCQRCDPQMKRMSDDEIFILGFDTAFGGNFESKRNPDDSALTILRMTKHNRNPVQVFSARFTGINDIEYANYIMYLESLYQFDLVVYDPNGGGTFVVEKLSTGKWKWDTDEGLKEGTVAPMVHVHDFSTDNGRRVLVAYQRGDKSLEACFGKMRSDSMLVNRMHKDLKEAINRQAIGLGMLWDGWENEEKWYDIDALRSYIEKNKQNYSALENAKAEMDLAAIQLSSVDAARDRETGFLIQDSFGMYSFGSRKKKDAAYGLAYAHVGCVLHPLLQDKEIVDDAGGSESNFVFVEEQIYI